MDFLDKLVELLNPEEIKILLEAEEKGILKISDSGRLKVCEDDWSNDPEFLDYLKKRFSDCFDCKDCYICETGLNNGQWLCHCGIKSFSGTEVENTPEIIGCVKAIPDRFFLIRNKHNVFEPDDWEEKYYIKLLPVIIKTYERRD